MQLCITVSVAYPDESNRAAWALSTFPVAVTALSHLQHQSLFTKMSPTYTNRDWKRNRKVKHDKHDKHDLSHLPLSLVRARFQPMCLTAGLMRLSQEPHTGYCMYTERLIS